MRRPQRVRLGAAVAAGLLSAALPSAAAAAASPAVSGTASSRDAAATVTVVHGVRGLVADVRLDGRLVLSGFAPERVTDPLSLKAGRHHVQVWRAGASPDSKPVLDDVLEVRAGQRGTAAIGLSAAGKPALTLYDDAALLRRPGSTALAVRGLAAAGPVRVEAGDRTLAPALTPTRQGVLNVAPGSYEVSAKAASGGSALVPPQDVPVAAGRAVVLYLIGSQKDSTLGWVAQTVRPSTSAAPRRVDTGVGRPPAGQPPLALLVLPAGLLAATAFRARRRQT